MNRYRLILMLILPLLLFFRIQSALANAATPARVVALSPALTEIIYALGLQNKLVGVSEFSDYPAEAKAKARVGPYTKPSLEKIYALRPDLVLIGQEGPADIKERLEQIHVPFRVISMRKLDEIRLAAIEIAKLMGNGAAGEQFARGWQRGLQKTFAEKSASAARVVIEIQSNPLIVAGSETFLDEIVKGCGGTNVVTQSGYPKLSLEILAHEKIDAVLLADYFSSAAEKQEALEQLKNVPSTAHAPTVVLNPDLVARPGPRLLKGAETVCAALRPAKAK